MKFSKEIILWIISILIALMWAAAAFGKLKDLEDFQFQLGQSPLLQDFEEILTWVVPYGELLLTVVLIYPATRLFALYTSVFLLWLFITYIVALLRFSYDVPCACSGFAEGLSWKGHVVFNIVFMVLAIIAIFILEDKKGGLTIKGGHSKILYNRAKANP
ncbi:MauE/DoxX family redox-associated membrane protein [Olivibacter domesticus]|uniref:Methylamine utilisation protein MauE n=1 Tax=Olivibacter domesticus TaxID=407022 RepID=A0A1H7WPI6_OLID1|nr:MauE/DoxX family redox-associated membrane protein [Olivibacter domesticus]SEM22857.1 Methylamine utilisation protein MauE [Olivibacter domesticus]